VRSLLSALGRFLFKSRNALFPAIFFCLALASRPIEWPASFRGDLVLDVLGILLAAAGQAFRILVIGLAYIRRGGLNKQVYAERLVQEGIFAHCRNPLYVGNFLALTGFCLIHDSWACYLVGIPLFALAYLAIVLAEEEFLRKKFGEEYDEYCRRVPRFGFRFQGLRDTIAGSRFDWRRVVRKEYGSTFSGTTFVLFLLVWDRWVVDGWPAARPALLVALAIWIPCILLYLVARWLKKTSRLGASTHVETPLEEARAR
jgi:protein-S-isoprenylcysteine O-methyltransferase Ste14